MKFKSFVELLYDTTSFHHRSWLILYVAAFFTPFFYIGLLDINMPGEQHSWLLDIVTAIIGCLFILATFRAIIMMFWTAVNTHSLTREKILRLILTYLFILFAFAGIYLVSQFHSEIYLMRQELQQLSGGMDRVDQFSKVAFSGVSLRFWPTAGLPIQWSNLPLVYLDMLYFSASTLTTLGFGDIVAQKPFVKILVILEALFGNLLLVLGVASIVPRQGEY